MALMSGLIKQLQQPDEEGSPYGSITPPTNSGISGGMGVLGAPPMQAEAPSPIAAAAAPRSTTTLMEGDPGKLADPNHIAKSPKYQFLSEATQYGRGQEGELLKDLQSKYGQYWNGVTFDGKGNFNVGNSDPAWDGVKHVDAYGGYNDGGDLRARWGVDDPRAAAPQGGGGGAGRPSFAGSSIAPALQADASGGIQQALSQMGGSQDTSLIQKLIAQLRAGA